MTIKRLLECSHLFTAKSTLGLESPWAFTLGQGRAAWYRGRTQRRQVQRHRSRSPDHHTPPCLLPIPGLSLPHPPAAPEPGPAPRVTHLQPRNQIQHPITPTLNCPQDPQVQLQGTCLAQAVLAAHSAVRLDTNSERHSQEA